MDKFVRVEYSHGYERLEVYHYSEKKERNFIIDDTFKTSEEEKERISLSRTKKHIREIALCNEFEYFATFTIDRKTCNRSILSDCQEILKKNLKKYKRKNSDFGYIFITEKHKEGGFHFHGLIKGINIENLVRYTANDYDLSIGNKIPYKLIAAIERGDEIYHFEPFDNNVGYNTISPIKDYIACCNYILKYITKDCVRNEHNQIYIASRGLKKAFREELMPFDLDRLNFQRNGKYVLYKNDYCKYIHLFPNKDLDIEQKKYYTFDVIPRKEFMKKHIDF